MPTADQSDRDPATTGAPVMPAIGMGSLDPEREILGVEIDNIVPTHGYEMLPVIGLGGSAGSITALKAFLEATPADTGWSFVVVIHLSPIHESTLDELLARSTSMPVRQVRDGMKAEPNSVYVIPPGSHLTMTDGHFRLTDLEAQQGKRVAVDLFFRSLADTHGPHATAIVLSGMDGDGAVGLKRIKERGGLTIAQDPNEAEFGDMPRSAIATGMVDWVLKAAEMAPRLRDYHRREQRIELPSEDNPAAEPLPPKPAEGEALLREVLVFLRTRTGRDFTCYKRATILRRIQRRMQVNGVDDLTGYLGLLRTQPGEAGALLKDLLISVTNFFRDRPLFEALEQRLPDLFAGKGQGDTVRVWVPACATGEEVYSVGMLLLEHARTLDYPPAIQLFGCDLDQEAVQVARAGVYPAAIAADVSVDRLKRFFIQEGDTYRVRRELREMVLFAVHDLLKDPPFSRMDLISCRNLLIYLGPEAQGRVFDTFHFALKPGGLLFLGSSESVEEGSALFRVLDKKNRLYTARPSLRSGLSAARARSELVRQMEPQARPHDGPVLPGAAFAAAAGAARPPGREAERVSWRDVHYKLLERFGLPSLIVNADYEIQYVSESAARFMVVEGGEPTTNLLRVVHPMLRLELRALLFQAMQTGATTEASRVPLELEGVRSEVNLSVSPAGELAPDYLLVIFDSQPPRAEGVQVVRSPAEAEPLARHLERELELLKTTLRDTVEQYEAGNEELKASNEELQAMNEELRSATEELETSREELQSINEELTTVNTEMKLKVEELALTNSDLQNLMAATAIATVFLDRDLNITRYTPTAVSIFRVIPGDVGRPLSDLRYRLDYPQLREDAGQVLASLVPIERVVAEPEGRTFIARLLPYRTIDDRIAGVVLTLVDITERQRIEDALKLKMVELTRFNRVSEDRELRMVELKREINELTTRLGEPARYRSPVEPGSAPPGTP